MRIVVIGSSGTIGRAVAQALAGRHEVIGVSRHSTPRVDIDDHRTIRPLLDGIAKTARPDAVVCCAGSGTFGKRVPDLTDEDLAFSVRSKLLGQVIVIREALRVVADGGSVTVTTGSLAHHPIPGAAAIAMVNAGLEGFVRAAALDAPRGIRVNAVSPPWIAETLAALEMDPSGGIPAAQAAQTYVAAVEGKATGRILVPGDR